MNEWMNIRMPCIVSSGIYHHSRQARCFLLSESQHHRQGEGQKYRIGYLGRKDRTDREGAEPEKGGKEDGWGAKTHLLGFPWLYYNYSILGL